MLKTFLVEDEVVIREMIKKMIPWEQYGFELDKKNIRLKNPIRTTGEYDVEVWVHQQVTSEVHISVVAE